MIDVKNKPTTFLIATLLLGAGMLMAIVHVVGILVGSSSVANDAGIGVVIYGPAVMAYVIQIIFYVTVGWLLLRLIYRWSKPAIIISTIVCPVALSIIMASIANQFGYTVDLSSPVGVGLLIFLLLTPLLMGAVAYNDIRYRLPKIRNQ